MKTCDYLLEKGFINRKQKVEVLKEQKEQKLQGVNIEVGQILLEKNYLSVEEILEALAEQSKEENMPKSTYIGEESKFTFDLKFLITMGTVIVSACGVYFSITGQIEELSSKNSPNRLEHDHLVEELDEIKEMGDLKIINYKLTQYDDTFKELKSLSTSLQPLASDLDYIKQELEKLKNKKIEIPDVDLSGIKDCQTKLELLNNKIDAFETRLQKVEKGIGSKF